MKMKKITIIVAVLLGILITACKDEIARDPSPVTATGCETVYFPSTNISNYELEPTVTSISVTVSRKDSTLAAEVPISIIRNDSNAFDIPSTVNFAANQGTKVIDITFPNAKIGIKYVVDIELTGDQFVNAYSPTIPTYRATITRIKWNDLGNAQFFDSFSFVTSSAGYVAQVKLQQRDDKPNIYRISYPYSSNILGAAEWDNWIGGNTQEYIYFTISSNGKNVTWDKFWYTNLIYKGEIGKYIKAYLPSAIKKDGDEESVVVYNEDNSIKYFELYPSFYIDGVGGWDLNEVDLAFPDYDLSTDKGYSIIN